MKKTITLLALLGSIGILYGCGKSNLAGPGGSGTDQAAVAGQLSRNPQFMDEEVSQSEDNAPLAASVSGSGGASAEAAITPINFWRHITHVDKTFEFAFSDSDATGHPTTAIVTVHKHLTGTFNILIAPPDSVFGRHVIKKPLDENWTRRILLKRVRDAHQRDDDQDDNDDDAWRVVSFSGVDVKSNPNTTHIVSLRVQAAGIDSTVTDPLGFFHITRGFRCWRPDSVVLTVTTQSNNDVVVLLRPERRFRFHNNGDNTYTAVFRTPWVLGIHHVGVGAFANGTIFDDQAAYDSELWLFPFVHRHEDLAAFRP
jgi:hypothetical protein